MESSSVYLRARQEWDERYADTDRALLRDISSEPTHRAPNLCRAPDSRTGCLEIIAHLRGRFGACVCEVSR
jgi:hypothetical protein